MTEESWLFILKALRNITMLPMVIFIIMFWMKLSSSNSTPQKKSPTKKKGVDLKKRN